MNWEQLLSSNRANSKPTGNKPDRSAFEVDYDRIVFSLPFRRLQDKTQVFPLPEDDFVHNRLTHSLEVASVGRSLGKLAGEQVLSGNSELKEVVAAADFGSIVSAASLAHDVGNPPFGHSGETAISEYFKKNKQAGKIKAKVTADEWADLTNFEGNAQGYRLINQSLHGLKLTYATLGAFTKYPRQSVLEEQVAGRASQKKYGFYQSEKGIFNEMADELGLKNQVPASSWVRHPLAFLVEAADDICYHIIDLEDGCTLGLVSLNDTIELLSPILGDQLNLKKLQTKSTQHEQLGTLRALAINKLINQAVEIFTDYEKDILAGSFDTALTSQIRATDAMERIKEVSIDKIYRAQIVLEKEVAGFRVLTGLLEPIVEAIIEFKSASASQQSKTILRVLPKEVTAFLEQGSLYTNLRVVLDYISGMTDSHALTMYRKIHGMSMPSW
jgi:dGTPase